MPRLTHLVSPLLASVLSASALLAVETSTADAAVGAPTADSSPVPESFRIATFNVLGGSHRSGRSTTIRTARATAYLNKHDVGVVGFQELEGKQYLALKRQTGDAWGVVGAEKRSGKGTDWRNSIAYRTSRFSLVSASHLAIAYYHGAQVKVPVATLRSRATGRTFTVINTHNPANGHARAQHYRNVDARRQVALVDRLRSQGRTVFVTGDMNERSTYFCKMTRSGQMHAASGGTTGRPCRAPKVNGVDWIFGSRDVTFSNWTSDSSTRKQNVSDHPIVVADASLGG